MYKGGAREWRSRVKDFKTVISRTLSFFEIRNINQGVLSSSHPIYIYIYIYIY